MTKCAYNTRIRKRTNEKRNTEISTNIRSPPQPPGHRTGPLIRKTNRARDHLCEDVCVMDILEWSVLGEDLHLYFLLLRIPLHVIFDSTRTYSSLAYYIVPRFTTVRCFTACRVNGVRFSTYDRFWYQVLTLAEIPLEIFVKKYRYSSEFWTPLYILSTQCLYTYLLCYLGRKFMNDTY